MTQERLNNLMRLHSHKDIIDSIQLSYFSNEFVSINSEHRQRIFGKF